MVGLDLKSRQRKVQLGSLGLVWLVLVQPDFSVHPELNLESIFTRSGDSFSWSR